MTLPPSLRAALEPLVRRLRAILGSPPPKAVKRAKPATQGKQTPVQKPAARGKQTPPRKPVARGKQPPARKPVARPRAAAKPAASRPSVQRPQEVRLRHSPPQGAPWRLLLLGGSNTVMKNGYVDGLIAALSDRRGPPARVTNLAVGGNSTVHGLMIGLDAQDIASHDIAVIEYGVNDAKLAKDGRLDLWRAATEGLLRRLLTARPDLHVVFALFARRDMTQEFMFEPLDATLELAAHYGATHRVSLVDIDHLYRDVLFPGREDFAALYLDGAHYARPQIAGLTGALIAERILGAPDRAAGPLPPPLWPGHFAEAQVIDLGKESDCVFENSRYRLQARRLAVGEKLTLDLPGPLAAVEYVSVVGAATLRILEEGEARRTFHTRNVRMGEPKFPAFLVRCEDLALKPWAEGLTGPRRVTFEALADGDPGEVRKSVYQIPAAPGRADGVYITRLLCAP